MFATPVRGLPGQPGARARDGPHLHPARRPRAERLDLDRASVRFVGHQPVRCHRRRRGLPVGPAHGGANEACLNMLEEIRPAAAWPRSASSWKVKDKNSGVKLMGFGHRVYKNYDPRAKLMRKPQRGAGRTGLENDPLFRAGQGTRGASPGRRLLRRASSTRTSTSIRHRSARHRHPVNLFTGIFALARTVGWIAQLNE